MGGGRRGQHRTPEQRGATDPTRIPDLAATWGGRWERFLALPPGSPNGPATPTAGVSPPVVDGPPLAEEFRVPVTEIWILRGRVPRIHLGPDGLFGGQLTASLPLNYEASTSKDEMLSEYLPAFWDELPLSWEQAHANVSNRWNQPLQVGLFWDDGWGFMHRAMLYAMQVLHQHADQARDDTGSGYSKFDADELRNQIAAGTLPLYVTSDQLLTTSQGSREVVISPLGHVSMDVSGISYYAVTLEVIEIPVVMQIFAGIADYYFWWAHRLHSSARETGNLEHWWVGLLCARAALSEIVQMAAIITHEWTHMTTGSGFHCNDLLDKEFGCIEWMIQGTFMFGTWAKLALPRSRNPTVVSGRVPENADDVRFDLAPGDGDSLEIVGVNQVDGNEVVLFRQLLVFFGPIVALNVIGDWIDNDASCKKFRIEMQRLDFWKEGGGYSATWRIPSRCATGTMESGAFVEVPS